MMFAPMRHVVEIGPNLTGLILCVVIWAGVALVVSSILGRK
jgi:hypothetical protein